MTGEYRSSARSTPSNDRDRCWEVVGKQFSSVCRYSISMTTGSPLNPHAPRWLTTKDEVTLKLSKSSQTAEKILRKIVLIAHRLGKLVFVRCLTKLNWT